MRTTVLFMLIAILSGCNSPHPQQETIKEVILAESAAIVDPAILEEDTTIYEMPHNTAFLDDWQNYFRENNQYKDWDKKDQTKILIKAVAEKDNTATGVHVHPKFQDTGNEDLRNEAVRLIENAKISPGRNQDGDIIRSNFVIFVFFPPQ